MKRLILIIMGVLLCTPLYSDMNTYVIGSGVAAGGDCSSCIGDSNDSVLHEADNTTTSATGDGYWLAWTFTVSSTECITGAYWELYDQGVGTATYEIYSDTSQSDPAITHVPDTIVGAGYTVTISNPENAIYDAYAYFAATQTLVPGTYWLIMKPSATSVRYTFTPSGTGTFLYSTDSGSTWQASTYEKRCGVTGCSPE